MTFPPSDPSRTTVSLVLYAEKVWIELLPNVLTLLATKIAWDALSQDGQFALLRAAYMRLGLPLPPALLIPHTPALPDPPDPDQES